MPGVAVAGVGGEEGEGKAIVQLNSGSFSLKSHLGSTFLKGFTGMRDKGALGEGRETLIWVNCELHKEKGWTGRLPGAVQTPEKTKQVLWLL